MAERLTIDFFAAQAEARRRSALLLPLLVLAFAATVLVVHLGALLVLLDLGFTARGWLDSRVLLPVAGGVLAVSAWSGVGTAWRLAADGGDEVARLLGGALVARPYVVEDAARLLNVVEEMAIAAGLSVPRVYLLAREPGVNAFTAGLTPERAVVVVTQGALDRLTREELQAVVAHELSHVLRGDVRLGTQLVAAVSGLSGIAVAGRALLETRYGLERRFRTRAAPFLAGVALAVAGSVGAFFARLVQCAVARQRELLADAAAVQFTRDGDALARALRKAERYGSAVASAHGLEVAHLLFAPGGALWSRLLATHPPVQERIARIAPHLARREADAADAATPPRGPGAPAAAAATPSCASAAARLLAALPVPVAACGGDPAAAAAVACALLVDRAAGVRARQLAALGPRSAAVERMVGALDALTTRERSAALALALPTLDLLDRETAAVLSRDVGAVASAGGAVTAVESAVLRAIRRRLSPAPRTARARRVDDLPVECLELLSAVAWQGTDDPDAAQRAVDEAARTLGVSGWRVLPRSGLDRARIDAALAAIDGAAPALKDRVVEACGAVVAADGAVSPRESEVLAIVAASVGCPLPVLDACAASGARAAAR